jgi:hypothetical protein
MSLHAPLFIGALTNHHSWLFGAALGFAGATLGSAVWALMSVRRREKDDLHRARNQLMRLEGEISRLAPIAESALSDVSLADNPNRVKEVTELRHALAHMDEELQKLLDVADAES